MESYVNQPITKTIVDKRIVPKEDRNQKRI